MKKARMSKSKVGAMMIVFFDIKGIIMIDWVPEGQMVNQKHYLEVLTKLRERVRKKRLELWQNKSWILHQDNVPAHNAFAVKQFLANKCIPMLEHTPLPPFTRFSHLWLLPVPQTEKCVERKSFSVCRWGEIKNGGPAEHSVSW
jgi:hypothetical protein